MKRSPLKRSVVPMKRGKAMRARSQKREQAYAGPTGRRALVARLLELRPHCESCPLILRLDPKAISRCGLRSVDVHERLARSAGGSILDEDNLITTCRWGHDWIGNHPLEALALGLRSSRYAGRNP